MNKIIAMITLKGWVGKTTTTNLVSGLVMEGKKALIMDLDPAGSYRHRLEVEPAGSLPMLCHS